MQNGKWVVVVGMRCGCGGISGCVCKNEVGGFAAGVVGVFVGMGCGWCV